MSDLTSLDLLPIEAGAFYVMDRGYTDFARLYRFTQGLAFFILPAKRICILPAGPPAKWTSPPGYAATTRSDCVDARPLHSTRILSAGSAITLPISTEGSSS